MVEVSFELVGVAISLFLMAFFIFKQRNELVEVADDLDVRLEEMQKGLEVVATVLQRIPELVPQFSINQSPIAQILEFIQGINNPEGSYPDTQLRDPSGRFADGETEETEAPE